MDRNQIEIAEEQGKALLALQEKERGLQIQTEQPFQYTNPYAQKQTQTERFLNRLPKGIDIVQEFELIQQKKSKLSRWQRDMIERIFNTVYKKADK
jgi:hypothetical protein